MTRMKTITNSDLPNLRIEWDIPPSAPGNGFVNLYLDDPDDGEVCVFSSMGMPSSMPSEFDHADYVEWASLHDVAVADPKAFHAAVEALVDGLPAQPHIWAEVVAAVINEIGAVDHKRLLDDEPSWEPRISDLSGSFAEIVQRGVKSARESLDQLDQPVPRG